MRLLTYSLAFIAIIGARETLSEGNGPVTNNLRVIFNKTLMTSSKIGLGVALMNCDEAGDVTVIGKGSKMLGQASHRAYVSAAKVDIYAK